jgi:very-short-patch-repair endonuclease
MTVVSSLRAQDLDLSRTNAVGVRLLRAYLDYAERGPEALRAAVTGDSALGFDSPFEQEVYEELTRQGLTVHRQVGCSGFRIDLAIVDLGAPGRYLLGVECDGATYHCPATARDRDRLRQEVLESLGWRICRIWSTDWLRDRHSQVLRVVSALEHARREELAPVQPAPATPSSVPQPELRTPAEISSLAAALAQPAALGYESIDEVPDRDLCEAILEILRTCGATGAEDLAQAVAHRLGFRRTGRRIQERIEKGIDQLARAGKIGRAADQRLQLAGNGRAARS